MPTITFVEADLVEACNVRRSLRSHVRCELDKGHLDSMPDMNCHIGRGRIGQWISWAPDYGIAPEDEPVVYELGDKVRWSAELYRVHDPEEAFGSRRYFRRWRSRPLPTPKEGVLVGLRDLQDTEVKCLGEDGTQMRNVGVVKAALVAVGIKNKHIRVPVDSLELLDSALASTRRPGIVYNAVPRTLVTPEAARPLESELSK